jgi:hypothetical protein
MVAPMTVQRQSADPLGKLLFLLAVVALALAPTQLNFAVKGIPLHPAEPFLALAALVWAIRWFSARDTASLPPFAHWLLLAAGALSVFALLQPIEIDLSGLSEVPDFFVNAGVLHSPLLDFSVELTVLKSWVMETAQVILYLLVAVTIYRAVFTTPGRLRLAIFALLATTTLAVALAVVQRGLLETQYQPDPAKRTVFHERTARAYFTIEKPLDVCSTFGVWDEKGFHGSRTGYTGFLALTLPFGLVLLLTDRRLWVRIWMGLLFAGAAVSVLAGLAVPALLLGLLVTGAALGRRPGRAVLVGVLTYGVFLLVAGGFNRAEVLQEPFRPALGARESARLYPGEQHLKKFWGEQYAALNIFRGNPVLGAGNGRYQARIGQAYDVLSPVADQRLEPDAQNGYLVALVNTGLVGLAAWLALLGLYVGLARRKARTVAADPWTAALFGALVALIAVFFVTNPWVRGTALPIAALLAAIGSGATVVPAARIKE